MNWIEFISGIYEDEGDTETERRPDFRPPASPAEIAAIEQKLGVAFPDAVRALLLQTNGVMELINLGDAWIDSQWLILPTDEILNTNQIYRAEWPADRQTDNPFPDPDAIMDWDYNLDKLLFFADNNGEAAYAYFETNSSTPPGIIGWRPIDDDIIPVTATFEEFLRELIAGSLEA